MFTRLSITVPILAVNNKTDLKNTYMSLNNFNSVTVKCLYIRMLYIILYPRLYSYMCVHFMCAYSVCIFLSLKSNSKCRIKFFDSNLV